MTYNPANFFDLQNIVVNEVVGSVVLTVIIALAVLWILGSRSTASNGLMLMSTALLLIIFFIEFSITLGWVLVILVVGTTFGLVIDRIMNK